MSRRNGWAVVFSCLAGLAWPRAAVAGMPSVDLTDMAFARVSTISFFLLVLLLCAWAVKAIWNSLTTDLPRLPRLTYGKACGLVVLWGLLFVLVLTMISGARELMTPGAWVKDGYVHKLAEAAPRVSPTFVREEKLVRLRSALWAYARAHDGKFPPDDRASVEVPEELWQVPDPSGMRYLYLPGRALGELRAVLVYEPGLYGASRMTLTADGEVRTLSLDALRQALGTEPKREAR